MGLPPSPRIGQPKDSSAFIAPPKAAAPQPSAPIGADNQPPSSGAEVGFTDLSSRWSEVLAKIKKYNHSLSFVLRTCQPKDVNGNKVCLGFKYKFHKDRVDESKMREIIQNTFREVYGSNLYFEAVIDENIEIETGNGEGGTETGNPSQSSEPQPSADVPLPTESVPDAPTQGNDMMNNLLKNFGGKIVG
jgi:hypothetical protein